VRVTGRSYGCAMSRRLFLAFAVSLAALGYANAALADPAAPHVYASTQAVNSGSSLTISKPIGVAPGDLLVIFVAENSYNTIAPPSGFTQKQMIQGTAGTTYAFYRIADGTEVASVTFTLNGSWPVVAAYEDVEYADPSSPFEDARATTSSSTASLVIPSVTPTDAPTLELAAVAAFNNKGTTNRPSFSPPAGWAEQTDLGTASTCNCSTALETLAIERNINGPTGTATSTATIETTYQGKLALSIRPALSKAPTNRFIPAIAFSPTLSVGSVLTAVDGSWSELPAGTTSWRWQRDTAGNSSFTDITGATNASYTLTSADLGNQLRVVATRTNSAGAATIAAQPIRAAPAAHVYASTQAVNSGSSLTVSKPSGVAPGDLLVIFVAENSYNTIAPPSGFTQKQMIQGTAGTTYAFYRIADGTEATSVTFTLSGSWPVVAAYEDVEYADPSSPFEDARTATSTGAANLLIPSVTAADAPTLELAAVAAFNNGVSSRPSFSPPAGWTEQTDLGTASTCNCSTALETLAIERDASGSTGTAISTASISTTYQGMLALSIRPALSKAPTNRFIPTVSFVSPLGVGSVLSATDGIWSELPAGSTSWRWQRDGSGNGSFADIAGATNASYTLTSADLGSQVRAVATRTNSAGAAQATSLVVRVAPAPHVYASTQAVNSGSSLTISKPAGVAPGDLLVIFVAENSTNTIAPPSGFTQKQMIQGTAGTTYAFYRIADGTEAASVTFTLGAAWPTVAAYEDVEYADPSSPFEDARTATSTGAANLLIPSVTPADAPTLELAAAAAFNNNGTTNRPSFSPPAGWTEQTDLGTASTCNCSTALETLAIKRDTAGATGTATSTASISTTYQGMLALSIRPALSNARLAPVSTSAPMISDVDHSLTALQVGDHLSASTGTWTNSPTSYSYQWQRSTDNGSSWSNISGATSQAYLVSAGDVGAKLRVVVTAANTSGSVSASSAATPNVVGAAPALSTAPSLTGTFMVGNTVTLDHGGWLYEPTSFVYEWERCDVNGEDCSDLSSANNSTESYPLTGDDLNSTLKVVVTASNSYGVTTVTTTPTAVILDEGGLIALAFKFRPALLFDQGEHWRPLDVNYFLAEGQDGSPNQVCMGWVNPPSGNACADIVSAPTLHDVALATSGVPEQYDTYHLSDEHQPDVFISIDAYHTHYDQTDYRSPLAAPCVQSNVLDCNGGDRSAIYWHVGQDAAGHRYFDYWVFYRYNGLDDLGFPEYGDNHQGDWEGLTVVTSGLGLNPRVLAVVFSQHTQQNVVLPGLLQFECTLDPSDSNCASFHSFPQHGLYWGQPADSGHVYDFVAAGSHASYNLPCTSSCVNPECAAITICADLHILPEGTYGGELEWQSNDDIECIAHNCMQQFQNGAPGLESWSQWVVEAGQGRWGDDFGQTINGQPFFDPFTVGRSPAGPKNGNRFRCTVVGYRDGTGGCSRPAGVPAFRRQSTAARTLSSLAAAPPRSALSECLRWLSVTTPAIACDSVLLSKTLARGATNRRGPLHLSARGHRSTDTGGLAQVGGPLFHPGEKLRLQGVASRRTLIAMDVFYRRHIYRLTTAPIRMLRKSAEMAVGIRKGRPAIVAWQGLKPVTVTVRRFG
jgi:hypothetical protein